MYTYTRSANVYLSLKPCLFLEENTMDKDENDESLRKERDRNDQAIALKGLEDWRDRNWTRKVIILTGGQRA